MAARSLALARSHLLSGSSRALVPGHARRRQPLLAGARRSHPTRARCSNANRVQRQLPPHSRRARVGGCGEHAALDGDHVGVAEAGVERRSDAHVVSQGEQAVAPCRRSVALDDHRRWLPARPGVETRRRSAQHPAPGGRPLTPVPPVRRTAGPSAGGGSAAAHRRPSCRRRRRARRHASPWPGTACAAAADPAGTRLGDRLRR